MLILSLNQLLAVCLLQVISASRQPPGVCDDKRRNKCNITLDPGRCKVGNEWYTSGKHSFNDCSGIICSEDGGFAPWSECLPDRSGTSLPPLIGCYVSGKVYAPGEYKFGQVGDYCYGIVCHPEGIFTDWDDWFCESTRGLSSSVYSSATSLPSPTPPPGCEYNGRWYSPGTYKSGQRYDRRDGFVCNPDGTVSDWADGDCFEFLAESAPPIVPTRWMIETDAPMLETLSSYSSFLECNEELDEYYSTTNYPTEQLVWN